MATAFLKAQDEDCILELINVNLADLENFTKGLYILVCNIDDSKLELWPQNIDKDMDNFILIKANNISMQGTTLSLSLGRELVNALVLSNNKTKYILKVKGVADKLIRFDVSINGYLKNIVVDKYNKSQVLAQEMKSIDNLQGVFINYAFNGEVSAKERKNINKVFILILFILLLLSVTSIYLFHSINIKEGSVSEEAQQIIESLEQKANREQIQNL